MFSSLRNNHNFCPGPSGRNITCKISPQPFGPQIYLHNFAPTLRATKLPTKFRPSPSATKLPTKFCPGPLGHKIKYKILPRPFGPQNYLHNFALVQKKFDLTSRATTFCGGHFGNRMCSELAKFLTFKYLKKLLLKLEKIGKT